MDLSPARCRFCKSASFVKDGWRYNSSGRKQRYRCKICGRRYPRDDGFLRMKFRPETISVAIDLYHASKSLREARNWLERHWDEFPLSHVTIWRWVHKYLRIVRKFAETLKPELSDEWLADEMALSIRGEWSWNWEVMDSETRFWIASRLTEGWERRKEDAEEVLARARERAKGRPRKLITDGLPAYEHGISGSLGWSYCEHVREVSWREGKCLTNSIGAQDSDSLNASKDNAWSQITKNWPRVA